MAYPSPRPNSQEVVVCAATTSIGATPVAGVAVAPVAGYIQRVLASAGGTTTGTITVAVTLNASATDIANGALTIAAGSNGRNNPSSELPLVGAGTTSGVYVSEGDLIVFTPSGGGGSSIAGAFAAVIRAI